ncbi:MAG: ABC transporter ATP-binding protein [Verrucomicrobiia bacterium]|jgi:ATP-binding cassette subfamily B protein
MDKLRHTLTFFRPDRARIGAVLGLLFLSIGTSLLKPWPLAIIVDSVIGKEPAPRWLETSDKSFLLLLLCLLILIIYVGHGALSALQNYLSIQVGLRGLQRVRNSVFDRLQRLSMRFHQTAATGDTVHRAAWDTYAFQKMFQQGLVIFATAALSLLLMLVVMWQMSVKLTMVALGLVPLLLLAIRVFGGRMRESGALAEQADAAVTSAVERNITGMPLIQSYTLEARESRKFTAHTLRSQQRRLTQHGWELIYWLAISIVFGVGMAAIVWVGSQEVIAGELTIGTLLIFVVYLGQLYEPLNQLSHVGATVATASAGTRRVFELLESKDEVAESPDALPIGGAASNGEGDKAAAIRGEITFENISFGYAEGRPVLSELSFELADGESAALIGPSGVGKTTLINLLPRFFDPFSGCVKLDGVDVRKYKLKDLRRQIALVLQEPLLMPTTLAENIGYGKPGASFDEIRAAAIAACADGFIEKLPDKYDTVVGDGAIRLSSGEKQRINIARAFLKDAPILLLDEPTSALDAESEAQVMESLARLRKGRTTVIVAHRMETVKSVDKVLVLGEGRLVESGSPEKLAVSGGYFQRIVDGNTSLLRK